MAIRRGFDSKATFGKKKSPAEAGRRGKIARVSRRLYSTRPMDSRHMKRKDGNIPPESAKPWWVAGPGAMLVYDYLGHWFGSKVVMVVILVLLLAILRAIFL